MSEIEIQTKLDTLAEYHSQRDAIELRKRALLDEVKIPAEVEALVSDGMKRMAEADKSLHPEADALTAQIKAELDAVVIPEEIRAALAEIDAKRSEIMARHQVGRDAISKKLCHLQDAIREEIEKQTRAVYDAVAARKSEIEAEFANSAQAVADNIAKLEAEIKADTKAAGVTIKGQYFMAVYVKGRVTWNTDKLDGMVALIPQIAEARKVGEPSITLRKV